MRDLAKSKKVSDLPVFKSFWGDSFGDTWLTNVFKTDFFTSLENDFNPKTDIIRTDNQLKVKVELPGLKKEDFSVELGSDYLLISGEKQTVEENEDKNSGFYSKEIVYGSFSRSIPVNPDELVENAKDQISAVLKNGVLEISVPIKKIEAKSSNKKIEVTETD